MKYSLKACFIYLYLYILEREGSCSTFIAGISKQKAGKNIRKRADSRPVGFLILLAALPILMGLP